MTMATQAQKDRIIRAYLEEGRTQRVLQEEILGIPAPERGGGYVAMEILHDAGVTGREKGILAREQYAEVLKGASPALGRTLLRLYGPER